MGTEEKTMITIQVTVKAPVELVWKCWTLPEDIVKWNFASPDWHTTHAENDLRVGGKFSSRMEAKDGSVGFDFWGTYTHIITHRQIDYTMGDDRIAKITFKATDSETEVIETFEAEGTNPVEMQRNGWQAILNNFKKHVEETA